MSGQIDILKRARRAAFENILRRTTLSGYVPKSSKVRSIIVACQDKFEAKNTQIITIIRVKIVIDVWAYTL